MQSKSKSTIVILVVLVIGFVLGSLTSGALRQRRVDRFKHMSPQDQFREAMEDIIKPDDKQREELRKIWEMQSQKIAEIQENSAMQIMTFVDSLKTEINSILNQEQRDRIQEHMSKVHEKFMRIQIGHMTRMLDLSEEQVKQLRAILAKHREMMPDGMFGLRSRLLKEDHEQFQKMESEIKAILTPEQQEKYNEFRQERKRPFNPDIFDGRRSGHDRHGFRD